MKALPGAVALLVALALMVLGASQESKLVIQNVLQPAPSASVVFGGDMMFDRSVRTYMREHGGDYIFSCIDDVLRGADLVVANLEGPVTSNPSVSENTKPGSEHNFTFTFDPSVAALLYFHNIRLVNLGNNHIMNFSRDGLLQTKYWLNNANVEYFGDPQSPEAERVARMELKGIPFAFVNWSDWTSDKTDHTVAQVRKEVEEGRVVVVYAHWGEEYIEPLARVRVLARQFVDAGAALVVGSHPHVVQEHEEYKGKHIYYSLGNFIFDQYFSDAVMNGLLLRVTFGEEGVQQIEELPVLLGRDRRTCLVQ